MNGAEREQARTLEILEAIEERGDLTQRHLARRLGVALGLANSYLWRCVRKGFVKIQQAPANRYVYYLTSKGFAEKSRLTGEYLSTSFAFYRKASESCAEALADARARGTKRVVLCGVSELAEIASLRAQELGVPVTGVFDPEAAGRQFLGWRVSAQLESADVKSAYMVTSLGASQSMMAYLYDRVPRERIVMPRILGLVPEE
jgi:DNA-binding MarR family transcriptional regulator